MAGARIDKYLWEVRLFKTRTIATEACRRGKVLVSGVAVKPSRTVAAGEKFQIKRGAATLSFEILALPTGRVGAKNVALYLLNTTPPEALAILQAVQSGNGVRAKGLGRPTKKDRRDLEAFAEDFSFFDDDFFEE